MRNDVSHKFGWTETKRPLELDRSRRIPDPRQANRNMSHHARPRLIVEETKARIVHDVIAHVIRERSDHFGNMIVQKSIELERQKPLIQRRGHMQTSYAQNKARP